MVVISIIFTIVCMIGGTIGYNPIRRKLNGIIGVGGCFICLIGIVSFISVVGGSITALISGAKIGDDILELIMLLAITAGCMGYMIHIMITKCTTTFEIMTLPLFALFVALGFGWRLMFKILLNMEMESGAASSRGFPKTMKDSWDREWTLISDMGYAGEYVDNRGVHITVDEGHLDEFHY